MGHNKSYSPQQDFSDWDTYRLQKYTWDLEESSDGRDRRTRERVIGLLLKGAKDEQGGFSDEVFRTKHMQEYILERGFRFYGYFSESNFRDDEIDEQVEQLLRSEGFNNEEIAMLLCSRDMRKMTEEYSTSSKDEKINALKKDLPQMIDRVVPQDSEEIILNRRIVRDKRTYAKMMLSSEIYEEIGEDMIMDEGMTLDKIQAIGEDLPLAMVIAMTGQWLAHPGMTADMITNFGYTGTVEMVMNIGPESIAKMGETELNICISEGAETKKLMMKEDYKWASDAYNSGLIQENTGVNIEIQGYKFEIHILGIDDKGIYFGLFLPGKIYSRRTILLRPDGHSLQVHDVATRQGLMGLPGLVTKKHSQEKARMYIPDHDLIDDEPDFIMLDKDRTMLVMEELIKKYAKKDPSEQSH